jgi:hypothetical protein
VTANTVETLNQTVAPKIKSPYLADLQNYYAIGGRILRSAQPADLTDAQIDGTSRAADAWATTVYQWLQQRVTPAAAERFAKIGGPTYSWDIVGSHVAGEGDKRNRTLNALHQWLDNLDALMRSDEMYPQ